MPQRNHLIALLLNDLLSLFTCFSLYTEQLVLLLQRAFVHALEPKH